MRIPAFPIDKQFINRWSTRAMSGELITEQQLFTLFEAARWAPSSYNAQPWHFIYAYKNTEHWHKLFNLLVPFNQSWAQKAGALVVIISRDTFEYNNQPNPTHSFCTGAAWENLALQASIMNIIAHGIAGFDYDRARTELAIPEGYTIEAMVAVGHPGTLEDLPVELQKKEVLTDRKPISTFAFEGQFKT